MISAITGTLVAVGDDRVELELGPMRCELLICAGEVEAMRGQLGRQLTLHTLCYLEGDPSRGNLQPRLIGFRRVEERRFFEHFTSVNGIGPRKALKSLIAPIEDIAHAIETGNTRFLVDLPQIGRRLAETIIATLSGRLGAFVASPVVESKPATRSGEDEIAIGVVCGPQIGLRRAEAESLLERVKRADPSLVRAEQLVPEMLRLHASG
ncbi:MAG: helix-hairpin-helix domain-containing protein [Phycisphaerae bacterium]|nr:helix-hairpin-helix domain-containing protein [Phycisphaerae bacterium]MDW8261841.1 Holliday junction branch migration protein RuvA [Phycisphaerales bacterium]